jgi:hypothetical protein
MQKLKVIYTLVLLFMTNLFYAQNSELDSIKIFIGKTKVDTIRIQAQLDMMDYMSSNTDDWYKVNLEIEKECLEKINNEKGKRLLFFKNSLAIVTSNKGYREEKVGDRQKADEYYQKAMNLFLQTGNEFGVAKMYNNMAFNQNRSGNIAAAIDYNIKALNVFKKLKLNDDIANSLINLAAINYNQDQTKEALAYLKEAEQLLLKGKDKKMLSRCYLNLSANYRTLKDSANMFLYFQKSVNMLKDMDDQEGLAYSYNNLSVYYKEKKDYNNATNWVKKSLEIRRTLKEKRGIVSSLINYGKILSAQEKWDTLKVVLDEANQLLLQLKIPDYLQNLHEEYYKYYLVKNQPDKALEHYQKHIMYRDSLANDKNKKLSLKQTFQYEYEKKEIQNQELFKRQQLEFEFKRKEDALLAESEIKQIAFNEQFKRKQLAYEYAAKQKSQKIENEKKELEYKERIKRKEIENKNQRLLSLFFIVAFVLMGALAYFIFRGLQQNKKAKQIIEKQKILVEEKQKEVIDSINYAKRIQQSILPTEKYIDKNINRLNKKE